MNSSQKPFFSIGVTTYQRKEMLKECLSSLLWQTFPNFEVMVANDYIEEKISAEMFGIKDKRVRFINNQQNLDGISNMNFLLKVGNNRYFTWLADDDMYLPNFLQSIYTAITKFNYPKVVFTSYMQGDKYPAEINNFKIEPQLFTGRQFLQSYLNRSVKTQGCYGVFDINYIKKIGGMEKLGSSWFSPYSDNLLALRAGELKEVVYINAPLIFYRTHEGSISYSSKDVDAYSAAQKNLLEKCVTLFRSKKLRADFDSNLYLLVLRWCIPDYLTVMKRSGSLQCRKLIYYLIGMFRYIKQLRNYRAKIVIITMRDTYRLLRYFILINFKKNVKRWR